MEQEISTNGGATVTLEDSVVEAFGARLRGGLIRYGEAGYEEARRVWNGMIDRYPALIVRAGGVADVINAVNFARENDLLLAVRGGGHNVAGTGTVEAGLLIDLSLKKGIQVDPERRTIKAGGASPSASWTKRRRPSAWRRRWAWSLRRGSRGSL